MTLFPNYLRYNCTFDKGQGAVLWDQTGKSYLDFGAGVGVVNLGHRHPKVLKAMIAQAEKLWHTSNLYGISGQQIVAEKLCALSGLGAAFFCNSGAEANEAGFKLARKWASEVKGITAPEIITFSQSFHGRTLATLTATGQAKVKQGFAPLVPGFTCAPTDDITAIKQLTTPNTAAICLELVQGEGGVHPADYAYIQQLSEWCQAQQILLMVDEIQTGIGRTGKLFAFEHYDLQPDILTLAKGLGNGFPVGAMLATQTLHSILSPGSHGTTFGGNPLAMSVASAVLDVVSEAGFLTEVAQKAKQFTQQLHTALLPLPLVKEIRSLGMMIGIELHEPAKPFIEKALAAGLVILPAGEHVLRLLPPLVVTEEQLSEAFDILKSVLSPVVTNKIT